MPSITLSVARMMITDVTVESAPRHIFRKIEEENARLIEALDAALKGSVSAAWFILFEGTVKTCDPARALIITHYDATAAVRSLLREVLPTIVTR